MMSIAKLGFVVVAFIAVACGRSKPEASDTKIVGGSKVTASDATAKSTVALVDPTGWQFCTGSLIDARHVVTASHCLVDYEDSKLYVYFGLSATSGNFASANLRTAKSYVTHESYDTDAMDADEATTPPNDIALITLSSAAPSTATPIKMLSTSDPLTVGETLTLAGFGLTKARGGSSGVLRKVDVKLIGTSSQAKEIEFGNTPGKSACMGDSGGPAFVTRGGKLALVGVTSRGSSNCDDSGIYTDVRYFRTWLSQKIAASP